MQNETGRQKVCRTIGTTTPAARSNPSTQMDTAEVRGWGYCGLLGGKSLRPVWDGWGCPKWEARSEPNNELTNWGREGIMDWG